MKQTVHIIFLLITFNGLGQINQRLVNWEEQVINNTDLFKQEMKDSLTKYDVGGLWSNPNNSSVYGFIGDNYQRISMKIISTKKDENNSDTYLITGKSMVKNNICQFRGTIKITKGRMYKTLHLGLDDEFKNKGIIKQGILIAEYHFSEDSSQVHSGVFDGFLSTYWYIDKNGILKYDDIEKHSDTYNNNQFVGTWKGFNTDVNKTCNWGDHRIPLCGDLDIGVGEFSPADEYLKYGWQTYRDAYGKNDKLAREEELKQWWK